MDNKDNDNDDKIIIESDHYDRQYVNDDLEESNDSKPSNTRTKKEKNKKNKQKPKKNFFFFFKRVSLICLIIAMIIGFVGGGFSIYWIVNANINGGLDLSKFEYLEPSLILDKHDTTYQELQGKEKRDIVEIDKIPDMVKNAFIDIEDERFYEHSGVDLKGLLRAGIGILKSQSLSGPGGSTITQQIIKLTHLSGDKKIERKVVEMYFALQLERQFTKDQILQAYLNKVGFANAWGIQAASQTYFQKNVDEISVAQAAVLASIIKSPTYYKPYVVEEVEDGQYAIKKDKDGKIIYNDKNKSRALAVIQQMKKFNHISSKEYDIAREQLKNNDFGLQEPPAAEIYSYFTDQLYVTIIDDLMASEDFSFDKREDAEFYLLNSGLTIHSTIDPKVQNVLDEAFKNDSLFPRQSSAAKQASEAMSKELGQEVNYTPEAAMTIIDNSNGHVVGIIGGRDKQKSRSLNRATQKFQVGSATKPLTVYAPGIETKTLTLGKTYDDIPIQIGGYKPSNAGGHNGMTTVREGIRKSVNTVAVQAWMDLGIENSLKYGKLLGLEFASQDVGPASLALGGYTHGQTTLAMASAFSTFSTEGTRNEPILYTTIEDRDGNPVLENKQEKIRVFSEQTAYLTTSALKQVVRNGTTSISVPNMEIAGKTGTTNNQTHAYFAGYSPYYTAAVWYGYDQNKVTVGGKDYYLNIGLYGGSKPGPAPMWQTVMREIHKGLGGKKLPSKPSGIVTANIDNVSGKLPTALTSKDARGSRIISEMFISGTVPTQRDDFHVEIVLDTSTGKIATEYCPESVVVKLAGIVKPANRFPSGVRAINSNYVPSSEKSVIVSSRREVCDIHGPDSVLGLQVFKDGAAVKSITLKAGESTTIHVKGTTKDGKSIDAKHAIEVTSNNSNVSVTAQGGNNFTITAKSSGTANITASLSYTESLIYKETITVTVTGEPINQDENPVTPPTTEPKDPATNPVTTPPVVDPSKGTKDPPKASTPTQ